MNEPILIYLERAALVATSVFTIYKLFFEKKKNDIILDDSKIKFLKEIQEFEEGKFRKMMEDYKKLEENEVKMKQLLSEQEALISRFIRRNAYLENQLKRHNIAYKPFNE